MIKELNAAKKAIEAAIAQLTNRPAEEVEIGKCLYCHKPIFAGETTPRGVHRGCYAFLRTRVQSGETTWERLQEMGRVGPLGRPGRKRKSLDPALDQPSMAAESRESYTTSSTKRAKRKSAKSSTSKTKKAVKKPSTAKAKTRRKKKK